MDVDPGWITDRRRRSSYLHEQPGGPRLHAGAVGGASRRLLQLAFALARCEEAASAVDTVLDALVKHDVALEINGALQRLDAASDVVRMAVGKGVKLGINTDSHHTSELGRMDYGVLTAQRGWAPRELVVNTWEPDRFFAWLASKGERS